MDNFTNSNDSQSSSNEEGSGLGGIMNQAKSFMGGSSEGSNSGSEGNKQEKIEEKAKEEGFGEKAKDFATDQVINNSMFSPFSFSCSFVLGRGRGTE